MKKHLPVFVFLFLFSNAFAQWKYQADAGINYTNMYLLRYTKTGTNTGGYGLSLSLSKPNGSLRITTQFVRLNFFNIKPTWVDMRAYSIESNLELLARLENQKTIIYPFAGISYQSISGRFTGINDYSGLRNFFQPNSIVKTQGPALNIGLGVERSIKKLKLCAHYRMHIGKSESKIMLTDVCVDLGIKYSLDLNLERKKRVDKKEKKHFFRDLLFPKGRYGWL